MGKNTIIGEQIEQQEQASRKFYEDKCANIEKRIIRIQDAMSHPIGNKCAYKTYLAPVKKNGELTFPFVMQVDTLESAQQKIDALVIEMCGYRALLEA